MRVVVIVVVKISSNSSKHCLASLARDDGLVVCANVEPVHGRLLQFSKVSGLLHLLLKFTREENFQNFGAFSMDALVVVIYRGFFLLKQGKNALQITTAGR